MLLLNLTVKFIFNPKTSMNNVDYISVDAMMVICNVEQIRSSHKSCHRNEH